MGFGDLAPVFGDLAPVFGDLAPVFGDLAHVLLCESREWLVVTWLMCCFGSLENGWW